ncbi:WD40-repeat-containing domain protein [Lipomyces oligophaga]|uniref:WD40-repeat-containing domain protein n=1 Tax=Lipomyces oligophaga TaxID=45792 RepID=UPI0034CFEC1A
MTAYKLSRTLAGHEADVRGVVFPTIDLIASVSRDCTMQVWSQFPSSSSSGRGAEWTSALGIQASEYLNSITWMQDEGLIACAGLEAKISVVSPTEHLEPKYVLTGHTGNVCALNYGSGQLISGSWDKTARVWQNGSCKYTLTGHEQAVWAVLVVGPDAFLTGSADKMIRYWKGSQQISIFRGHSDVVRSLCLVGEDRFASSSNDGSIKIWDLKGTILTELYGHTNFIYAVAYNPTTNELVSSGEDRSIRIWNNTECIQTITLPCTSVWSVAICSESGDIAAAASDGNIRLFSRHEQIWATPDELAKFDKQVAGYAISSNQVGNVNKEKLPGLEALESPGTEVGKVIMVRTPTSSVDAYQWSGTRWDKVGEVVSAVGSAQKQTYEGREYDYVFEVNISDDKPVLKLPYNATENPYDAARRFLEKNELPLSYLDETAKFIERNTGAVQIGEPAPQRVVDPYADSYRRQLPSSSTSSSSTSSNRLYPQKTYLYIKKANVPGVLKKVNELNQSKANSGAVLSTEELATLALEFPKVAENAASADAYVACAKIGLKIVELWRPPSEALPGLDILRSSVGQLSSSAGEAIVKQFLAKVLPVNSDLFVGAPNNAMMAVRVLANMFEIPDGGRLVVGSNSTRERILDIVREAIVVGGGGTAKMSKAAAIGVSTLILNTCIYAANGGDDSGADITLSIVGIAMEMVSDVADSEAAYRLVVSLGTLVASTTSNCARTAKMVIVAMEGNTAFQQVKAKFSSEERISTALNQLLQLI